MRFKSDEIVIVYFHRHPAFANFPELFLSILKSEQPCEIQIIHGRVEVGSRVALFTGIEVDRPRRSCVPAGLALRDLATEQMAFRKRYPTSVQLAASSLSPSRD